MRKLMIFSFGIEYLAILVYEMCAQCSAFFRIGRNHVVPSRKKRIAVTTGYGVVYRPGGGNGRDAGGFAGNRAARLIVAAQILPVGSHSV